MELRVSGWILPDGSWLECRPWEHITFAKSLPWVNEQKSKDPELLMLWDNQDEERLRQCFGRLGMGKVCYHLIDADFLNLRQLRMLQQVYGFFSLEEEVEFIGRIRGKIQLRVFTKIRDPERLNRLGG